MSGAHLDVTGVERCKRGHDLTDPKVRYEEKTPRGVTVRCRICRAAQRRKISPISSRATLETLIKRQRPDAADIAEAQERWLNGDAARTLEQVNVNQATLARLVGVTRQSAGNWFKGKMAPQRRLSPKTTAVLMAADALLSPIRAPVPEPAESPIGDAALLLDGSPEKDGPWRRSPPHTPELKAALDKALKLYHESGGTCPKHYAYWPAFGLLSGSDEELLEAHGYLEDPRTERWAEELVKRDREDEAWAPYFAGWSEDRWVAFERRQVKLAAGLVHYQDMMDGQGCRPGCAHCAAIRHGVEDPQHNDCPDDCAQCAAKGLAGLRASSPSHMLDPGVK